VASNARVGGGPPNHATHRARALYLDFTKNLTLLNDRLILSANLGPSFLLRKKAALLYDIPYFF